MSDDATKLVYIKRWRTLVKLPAQYADEIVEALRDPAPPMLPCPVCGGEAIHAIEILKRTVIQQ